MRSSSQWESVPLCSEDVTEGAENTGAASAATGSSSSLSACETL